MPLNNQVNSAFVVWRRYDEVDKENMIIIKVMNQPDTC